MIIRLISVILSILSSALQGASGAVNRKPLIVIGFVCDFISWMDILLKTSLAYYKDDGIVIYNRRLCAIHYFKRGFLMDLIGSFPWYKVLRLLMNRTIDENQAMLISTTCKYAHLYLVMGYFNYIGDTPNTYGSWIIILKWQVVVLLVTFGASQLLMSYCIQFEFDDSSNLVNMTLYKECWLQGFHHVGKVLTIEDLYMISAESINLAQCALLRVNYGAFQIDRSTLGLGFTLLSLNMMYWYIMCYSLTLLVLKSRGNVLFQHGVVQLEKFLKSERVDKKFIRQALAHFTYWWSRTNGINIHNLSNDRLGVVFRQDLNYYFYHKTFTALDSLLNGGKSLERQLASSVIPQYVLPTHEIVREMDLTSGIYIINRGKVIISQKGQPLCVLTRGSIFGQLDGTTKARPIKVSAAAEDYVDLLPIHVKTFHELISDKVRETIAIHPTSSDGYMMAKKYYVESPYDTIKYFIGIRKTIQLPWMKKPVECRAGNWYSRFLFFSLFIAPVATCAIVIFLVALPAHIIKRMYIILLILDVSHLLCMVMEFFSMKLVIISNKCEPRIKGLSVLKKWYIYVDLISLLVPMLTFVLDEWRWQVVKLLRLRLLYAFNKQFCTSFKSRTAPILLKVVIFLMVIHSLSCLWIAISCRDDIFPLDEKVDTADFEKQVNLFVDRDQWVMTHERVGGCARFTVRNVNESSSSFVGFLKPKYMQHDYVVSTIYVLFLLTHAIVATVAAITLRQIYFKVFLNYTLYLLNMWLLSAGISFVYTRFRELYQHDYNVQSLLIFLKQSGISPVLVEAVEHYTKQIWKRQKGDWLPELAQTAPICIRQDLFCALYMHHLQTPVLFRTLPHYFIRQVAARLRRIVVFPGKYIVHEGDISSTIYWIHEGEVEKWVYSKTGENRMISLLSTNGYFGFIPGLFPNVPFQFSYCTRTVVDIVYLKLRDWQDLLDGYPDIKRDLYNSAKVMRREIGHSPHQHRRLS